MANTLLSSDQVIKEAFNAESNSLDVSIVDTAIGISLNHKEDSVSVVSKTVCAEIKANELVDILGIKQVTVYAPVGTSVIVSPSIDKDVLVKVAIVPESGILTLNICAARITLDVDGHVVGA